MWSDRRTSLSFSTRAVSRHLLRGRVTLVKEEVRERRGKEVTKVNEPDFSSWAGRRLNPLWIVVRKFGAEVEEKTHDGADSRTTLPEGQVVDHPKDATLLGQQMDLTVDPGHWDAMTLRPK